MRSLRTIVALLFTMLCQAVCASPASSNAKPSVAIDYEVRRLPSGDRYEITLRFKGEHSGRSTLWVPTQWAGATHAERGIEGLEVLTAGARLEESDTPQVRHLIHRPDAMLTVRYRLKQIADGEPSMNPSTPYLPIIRPDYFAWIGWTAWIVPYENDQSVEVKLVYHGLPATWSYASSFGLDRHRTVFRGWIAEFRSAVFVGGDFRLDKRALSSGTVIVAMRGKWAMHDGDFADRIADIVSEERAFWLDEDQQPFLVTLVPMQNNDGGQMITGTGLTRSFAAFLPAGTKLDEMDSLWTHEYFHHWNNRQLGQFREPQALMYWFSEGFTEYYTSALMLRRHAWTLDRFVSELDSTERRLVDSPDRTLPNSEVPAHFFTSDSIGQLPYLRGYLLAARWDGEIRKRSKGAQSLDDAMRALRDEHRAGRFDLDVARIVRVMEDHGVADAAGDIARQVDRGELPQWSEGMLGACVHVGEVSEPRYDIGFDRSASEQNGTLVDLRADGPAYAAGLRETDTLRSIAGGGRATKTVVVGVQTTPQSEIRVVSYLPAGVARTRPSMTVADGLTAEQRTECLRAFGPIR